jgi:hypothetical protein
MAVRSLTIPAPIPVGSSTPAPGPLNDGDVINVAVKAATTHAPKIVWGSSAHMPSPMIGPLNGSAYIWLVDTGDVASAVFTLDGKVPHTESWPPYDFAGTAPDGSSGLPWDTTKAVDGAHTIAAVVTYKDGTTATASVTPTVHNVLPPPPPPPPPVNPSDLQADIAGAGNGSTLNLGTDVFTVPGSGYNAAGKTGLHLIGGTLKSPSAQAALGPGVDWWIDGITIDGSGNHETYSSGIWAYGAHGLRITNPHITDFMYAGIMVLNSHGAGEAAPWDGGGYIARIAGSAPDWNAYGSAHTSDDPSKFSDNFVVRGTAAKPWVIEDIPAWQGINNHNAKNMTYDGIITRRVRRAFWFSPIGNFMITGLLVTHCRAEDPGGAADPTAYFTSSCDSAKFIDNFMSNRYPRYDANDGVRDYGGDVNLQASGMTYG